MPENPSALKPVSQRVVQQNARAITDWLGLALGPALRAEWKLTEWLRYGPFNTAAEYDKWHDSICEAVEHAPDLTDYTRRLALAIYHRKGS